MDEEEDEEELSSFERNSLVALALSLVASEAAFRLLLSFFSSSCLRTRLAGVVVRALELFALSLLLDLFWPRIKSEMRSFLSLGDSLSLTVILETSGGVLSSFRLLLAMRLA